MPSTSSANRANFISLIQGQMMAGQQGVYDNQDSLDFALIKAYKKSSAEILKACQDVYLRVLSNGGSWDANSVYRLNRDVSMFNQINSLIHDLGGMEVDLMTQSLSDTFVRTFLNAQYAVNHNLPAQVDFSLINPRYVTEAINYPWSGGMFSDRIWANKTKLASNLRQSMVTSMILGEGMGKIAKRINDGLGNSQSNALRVARTETMRISYDAVMKGMKESGVVDKVEYLATDGVRTCEICEASNNKVFEIGHEISLPRHPHCRCTYLAWFGDKYDYDLNNLTPEQEQLMNMNSFEDFVQYAKDQIPQVEEKVPEKTALQKLAEQSSDGMDMFLMMNTDEQRQEFNQFMNQKHYQELTKKERLTELFKQLTGGVTESFNEVLKRNLAEREAKQVAEAKALADAKKAEAKAKRDAKKVTFVFGNGTSVSDKKPRPAIIKEIDGITYATPSNPNPKRQHLTIEDMVKEMDRLPQLLKNHVHTVEIVDYANPQDSYWAKKYKMLKFKSFATGGGGITTIYSNDSREHPLAYLKEVIPHEAGHGLDRYLGAGKYFSEGKEWFDIMESDAKIGSDRRWVSNYALKSQAPAEDFADSVNEYVVRPDNLKNKFPARWAWVSHYFESGGK